MNAKTETVTLPRCHFCKEEIGEGHKLVTRITGKTVYICFDCTDLIAAVAHDLGGVFTDISHIINSTTETWKERLEPWQYEEAETK